MRFTGYYGELNFFAKWLPEWLDTNYTNKFQVNPYGIVILDTIMNFNNTKFSQKAPNLQVLLFTRYIHFVFIS